MARAGFVARCLRPCALAAFMTVLTACGGGNGDPPDPRPASLAITGVPVASMMPGESAQLAATLTYSDASTRDATTTATWSTSDASVLAVASNGSIRAVAPGQAEVVASAERLNSRSTVRVASPAPRLAVFAGDLVEASFIDGPGAAARFRSPRGIAADGAGNLYIADSENHTIRRIDADGIVSTLAGLGGVSGSSDGAAPDARFDRPSGIAVDRAGNVYVGDTYNFRIRKISPAGVVSTLAGSGEWGNRDGIGGSASFGACSYVSIGPPFPPALMCSGLGLATDEAGNVYAADSGNHTIRRITPAGTVSTLAGKAGSSGSADGAGPDARFNGPGALALDGAGDVYVADNESCTVRKLGPTGAVQTIVGAAARCGLIGGPLPGALAGTAGVAISSTSLYVTMHDGVAVVTDRP